MTPPGSRPVSFPPCCEALQRKLQGFFVVGQAGQANITNPVRLMYLL